MKNLTPLIYIAFSAVLFSACNREQAYTEVSGQVYQANNGSPVPYAKVRFEWWDYSNVGSTRYFVDSTTADAQGYYSLSGEVPPDESYYVIADAPSYFETERTEVIGLSNVQRGRSQTVNLDLIPYAWVRMNIKKTGQYEALGIGRPAGTTSLTGNYVWTDTVLYSRVWGNQEVRIPTYRYVSIDEYIPFHYYVNTIGHDTVDVFIDF